MDGKLAIVTLKNDDATFARMRASLERQAPPGAFEFIPVDADKDGWNAARGLNHGIESSTAEWVVCVHQDVIFPDSWYTAFSARLRELPDHVRVLGLVGVRPNGAYAGHIKDPHGHAAWRPLPRQVISVDEHLIAIRRTAGLAFDPDNPGFHCYGTDICLSAKAMGYAAFVVDAPVVHLSKGKIDTSFGSASSWLLEKWGKEMKFVIPTCAFLIERKLPSNFLRREFIRLRRMLSSRESACACGCNAVDYSPIS